MRPASTEWYIWGLGGGACQSWGSKLILALQFRHSDSLKLNLPMLLFAKTIIFPIPNEPIF
jgi:hypothetical protein